MKRSNRLVLLIGVFLAVIAFVGIALLLTSNKPTEPGPAVAIERTGPKGWAVT